MEDKTYFDQATLGRVIAALKAEGIESEKSNAIIDRIHNHGILFRERLPETDIRESQVDFQSDRIGFVEKVASPHAETVVNEKGGGQSHIPVRFDLIDGRALFEMAAVLHTGAEKYGEGNWRKIDVNDHLNHLLMHTYAYLSGDTSDEHLSHILCRATFALGVNLEEDNQP